MADTQVLDAVAAMPPMVSSEYHVVATGIAARLSAAEMDALERCVTDASDPARGFNALYVLLARHRRALDAGRFRGLYQRHAARFDGVPMRAVLDSDMAMLEQAGPDLVTALRHAETALAAYPGNLALVAHHARVLAEYAWSGGETGQEDLASATGRMERAIETDPERPRFRAVHAQLAGLLGDFALALTSIQRALDLEDSEQPGYAMRVVEYHRIRADITLHREATAIRGRLDEATAQFADTLQERLDKAVAGVEERAKSEIGKVRSETLGTLGLLAAVIAFIVTTTQIADRQPVDEALRLLTGCAGMLSLVFTAFAAVFGVVRPTRLILPALLGSGLLLAAFLT
ncbi:hypothetical protein M8I34_29400 [Streptomyces sp. MCA2]|uniref:hypothetical protein n=1 Tax=Streptomyces sp. MCA2 TaxID=2944805 RepID=UPI00202295A3|nr:hypothetical protein [Streptomyces sp. MCA2]MCL7495492.1 hypothetical protein [Streptomyces sp. MCA2]